MSRTSCISAPASTHDMWAGTLLSLVAGACYGMLGILAKLAYAHGMTEMQILPVRFFFGTALLGALLLARRRSLFRVSFTALIRCAGLGLVIFCLQSTLFFKSLALIPASTAILIIYCSPVVIALLSSVVFRTPLTRPLLVALGLVVLGCCLVFQDAFTRAAPLSGLALAAAAMLIWSVYALCVQATVRDTHPLSVTFYVFLFTGVGFCIIGEPSVLLHLDGPQLGIGVLMGLVPTALALGLLYMAIDRIGSTYACLFASVEPVATIVAAWLMLDEHLDPWQLAGAALILAGVVLPNLAHLTFFNRFARR